MRLLDEKPQITKSISAAIVQGIGDVLSQSLFAFMEGQALVYDFARTISFMLTGFFFNAPFLHRWYGLTATFGERLQQKERLTDTQRVGAELALDQSLGVVLYYPLYFYAYELCSAVAYCTAPNFAAITEKGIGNIIKAIKAQYLIWPMSQLISFRFVPQKLRVMHTSLVSIFWNIFFCAIVAGR
ncbi:hypothetical protein ACA910_005244 [Epithemia clementina (nom. ined.)]